MYEMHTKTRDRLDDNSLIIIYSCYIRRVMYFNATIFYTYSRNWFISIEIIKILSYYTYYVAGCGFA